MKKKDIVELKFQRIGEFDNVVSKTDNEELVLLDKYSKLTPAVQHGETWQCEVFFEKPTKNNSKFFVVKPIKRTKEAEEGGDINTDVTLSHYQNDVVDFVENGEGNGIVPAVAGGGKTFTLLQILARIPRNKTVLFLAFNKDIVKELKRKVPSSFYNVDIRTCHSFGYKCVSMAFGGVEIEESKYRTIAKTVMNKWDLPTDGTEMEYVGRVIKLADLARLNLIETYEELEELANKHEIELTNGECDRALDLINLGMEDTKHADFTDMIFFPNVMDVKVKQYDFVLIDECQDLNTCQRELMLKAVKPETGRFIAVGDPKQAIYGFAGADINSYNTLKDLPNTKELPLSICYRCDKSIIRLAQTIVPYIEARDDAEEGEVNMSDTVFNIKSGDMVLCRNTFPLVRMCLKYLANGIKAHIKGRDIGINLINMIKNTKMGKMEDVFEKLELEERKVIRSIMKKENLSKEEAVETSAYQAYKEKVDVIKLLSEGLELATDVIAKIEGIFSDDEQEGIALSTIHKSKGLEADRVFIIHREKMPSKFAIDSEWMMEQEYNLMYVAYTRAKHHLGFVADFNAYDDKMSADFSKIAK